jgi:hypothetical protein
MAKKNMSIGRRGLLKQAAAGAVGVAAAPLVAAQTRGRTRSPMKIDAWTHILTPSCSTPPERREQCFWSRLVSPREPRIA